MKNSIVSYLFIIFFLALSVRLIYLGSNPVAISHDELDYVLNGRALALSGSDLSQQWQFWKLEPIITETISSEFFPILQAIPAILLPQSMFSARILSAFLSALTVLVLGMIVYELSKNKKLTVLTALVFSFNPWSILFSHTAYEAPNALSFFLLGIYFLLLVSRTTSRKFIFPTIFSAVFFLMGFYVYHGTKLVFPFVVGISLIWNWFRTVKSDRGRLRFAYGIIGLILMVGMIWFTLSLGKYSGRQSELILMSPDRIASLTNDARRLAFHTDYGHVFINKYTFLAKEIFLRYLGAFDLVRLFVTGQDSSILFSLFHVGYFYLIELPLAGIGAVFWYKQYRRESSYLFALLIIAPIPAALHVGDSIALRAALLFPLLSLFIGGGWLVILNHAKKSKWWQLVSILFIAIFAGNVLYFFQIFHNHYPLYSAENYYFNERLLSEYVSRMGNQKTTVLVEQPYHAIRAYLFYIRKLDVDTITELAPQFVQGSSGDYTFENIIWTSDCRIFLDMENSFLIAEEKMISKCRDEQGVDVEAELNEREIPQLITEFLASPTDSRHYFNIYNQGLCAQYELGTYVYNNDRSDFAVAELTDQQFCKKWVVQKLSGESSVIK